MSEYQEFIARKFAHRKAGSGFTVDDSEIHPMLFPFQRTTVKMALERGRMAIFADCGLGKTFQQIEWARIISERAACRVLILCPLAVAEQTVSEAARLGVTIQYLRKDDGSSPIVITNYEMLKHFDPASFGGVVLDESSILKAYMGKTKRMIIDWFKATPYKLACTATPAPNDHMEIGNHAEFLGVMPSNEMLSRWFINDTSETGNYKLKRHAVIPFWDWVASWSVCVSRPADIGDLESDASFALPELSVRNVTVEVDQTVGAAPGELIRQASLSATQIHAEMRLTCKERAKAVAAIEAASEGRPFIAWCNTDYEADALKAEMPHAVEVRGSEPPEKKSNKLNAFTRGEIRTIITKPSIAGYGLNWQHCSDVAFVGMSYSYEDFYQALRRTYRFGQIRTVNAHVIAAATESAIVQTVMDKMKSHEGMKQHMIDATRRMATNGRAELTTDYKRKVRTGENWTMINGDCVEEIDSIPDASLDFSIFSPPFSNLYIYSDSARDMGNCANDDEFMEQFSHLVGKLFNKMRPGRIVAVHCKDLVDYIGRDGESGLRDFPGEITRLFQSHGFKYASKVTLWKDPVTEMQRTKNHGLLHKTTCMDTSFARQGLPDYLLAFRRWPKDEAEKALVKPVTEGEERFRFTHYIGMNPPSEREVRAGLRAGESFERAYSIAVWQRYASPVWDDIDMMNVLNIKAARDDKDEKHICPLQLEVIGRAVHLWSSPGDTVFSPFAGIGSEGVASLEIGRKFIGIELKDTYFKRACNNLKDAEKQTEDMIALMGSATPVDECGLCGSPDEPDHACAGGIAMEVK